MTSYVSVELRDELHDRQDQILTALRRMLIIKNKIQEMSFDFDNQMAFWAGHLVPPGGVLGGYVNEFSEAMLTISEAAEGIAELNLRVLREYQEALAEIKA